MRTFLVQESRVVSGQTASALSAATPLVELSISAFFIKLTTVGSCITVLFLSELPLCFTEVGEVRRASAGTLLFKDYASAMNHAVNHSLLYVLGITAVNS